MSSEKYKTIYTIDSETWLCSNSEDNLRNDLDYKNNGSQPQAVCSKTTNKEIDFMDAKRKNAFIEMNDVKVTNHPLAMTVSLD